MAQITFKNIDYWWLVIIPILVLLIAFLGSRKKERILSYINIEQSSVFTITRSLLTVIGVALIYVSFLGPQQEIGTTEVSGEGLDIFVLMDTSNSMMAPDIIPSRLDHMKAYVDTLIDNLEGHRVGFIPYASSAYIQMPLTDDYNLAKMFLSVVDTEMIGGGGTDLADAISVAVESFELNKSPNQVILIFSDGEEEDDKSSSIIKGLSDTNITVYTIGVGTLEGSIIPIIDSKGNLIEYKKDKDGETVITRLDESLLQEIAYSTRGKYFLSDNSFSSIDLLLSDLSSLKTAETSRKQIRQYTHLYQYFLALGVIMILIAIKLPERRMN